MPLDTGLSERLPTQDEVSKALSATRALAEMVDDRGALSMRVRPSKDNEVVIDLPPAVSSLVLELLMLIGRGEAVTLVPFGAVLTTQEAADLLNVSRPFLIKLIEKNEIPHHMVGTHRRVNAEDILAYKRRRDIEHNKALDELARLGQEIEAE